MPKIKTVPEALRPYIFHGVNIEWEDGKKQAVGDCPFCGREGKLGVSIEDGLWRCLVCGSGSEKGGGNVYTFLRLLWEQSDKETSNTQYDQLAADRKILLPETLSLWEICQSVLTKDWLVPGYSHYDGKINQLYVYAASAGTNGRRKLLGTAGLPVTMYGVNLYDPARPVVYLCEGPWDAMVLWETLKSAKRSEGGELALTGSEASSLLPSANVLAVPGCGTFLESWAKMFSGKVVYLMYDSDHPRKQGESILPPAGYAGMRKVAKLLGVPGENPREIHYLHWGDGGYAKDLPSGYDIRDLLSRGGTIAERVPLLQSLLAMTRPIPDDWIEGRSKGTSSHGGTEIDCLPCYDWKTLVNAWRKALKWTEGLDRALSVMLACITSTESVGDQLWVKILGPAACGKSTLCEALSINKRYILAKSTIRGFHSGFQISSDRKEDNSLLSLLKNKTLVTKDGDTLLQSPNLSQILSEARDVYDRVSRTHYRNKASKDYEGVSCTWLLCGTSSLRALDSSELGERFLDCVIIEDIDEDMEDEIGWRVANRAEREMSFRSDGKMETRDEPAMVEAKRLTGGYIGYLRRNSIEGKKLLDQVRCSPEMLRKCQHLAKFVAFMRARPSMRQEEKSEREMSFRLISQLVRLAKFLAVVMNFKDLNEEVMRRVKRVALDTARGRTLVIAHHLYEAGDEGLGVGTLAAYTNQTDEKEKSLLRFLRNIGVVSTFKKPMKHGMSSHPKWRLTDRMRRLYKEVVASDVETE